MPLITVEMKVQTLLGPEIFKILYFILMKLKKFKPTSPGVRHKLSLYKNLLGKNSSLLKKIVLPLKRSFGRSTNNGRITA
jgi:hypothetical protein